MKSVSFFAKGEKPKATRDQAMRVARQLGCRGAHQSPDGSWMPCASMDDFEAIKKGKSEYIKHLSNKQFEPRSVVSHRVERYHSKSPEYYKDRGMALAASKRNGCSGVRVINLGGERYYAPCVATDKFEPLGARGVIGIETMPGGGLVSAPVAGKAIDVVDIDSKGFVNFVSRSTDPDVFSNPDSARIRARNLGCIGIRRYTANDGKTVWLPCSNGSDYNRVMNIRGDNSPRNFRRGQPRSRGKSEELAGSVLSEKRARKPKRKVPVVDSDTINKLAIMVRRHNASVKDDDFRTNLRDVRIVYIRGLISGDESDALDRVKGFLELMSSSKPLPKSKRRDFDLVPANHPSKDDVKSARTDSMYEEGQIGVRIRGGCCPVVVKRYRRL